MGRRLLLVGLAVLAAGLPFLLPSPYFIHTLVQGLMWAILAASWDILSGYTGQISFGHAGFFAIGAYAAALLSKAGVNPWLGLALTIPITAFVGLLIGFPALRVRGHYLALVTLGFSEVVRVVAINWRSVTGGPFGMYDFPIFGGLPTAQLPFLQAMYLIALFLAVISGLVLWWLGERSQTGQVFKAIREDEVLAGALGLNVTLYKLTAFAVSAGFAGLAGGFYAYYIRLVSPQVATTYIGALAIGMAMFGGTGTIIGPLAGAMVLSSIQEYLRFAGIVWNQVALGLVMILFVIVFPRGMSGWSKGLLRPVNARRLLLSGASGDKASDAESHTQP